MTIYKMDQLLPTQSVNHRIKRGLIDPLGSLIKVITGNLDHSDAMRYDNLISQIHSQQIASEKKITLISQMMNSVINNTSILYENSRAIDKHVNKIEKIIQNITNNSIYVFHLQNILDLFIFNFRTIYIRLEEIETALAFSRLSILHQSIINTDELLGILQSIEKTNNLLYTVNLRNLRKLENTILIKSYVKYDQITLILEIPLIENVQYNYFKVFPLPMYYPKENITRLLIPEHPYLLAKDLRYLPIANPCKALEEDKFICYEKDISLYEEETCIIQLMKFKENLSNCKQYPVHIENTKIQKVHTNTWIAYLKEKSIFTKKCNGETEKQILQGTYIITINEDCDIHINSIQLYGQNKIKIGDTSYRKTPVIELPKLEKYLRPEPQFPVNLKGVQLDDLKMLSYALKKINSENSENLQFKKMNSGVNILNVVIYLILIIMIVTFCIFKYYDKIVMNFQRNHRNPEIELSENPR